VVVSRDDQPRAETAKQIALAIRDEVIDLEAAGIRVIQIDETGAARRVAAAARRLGGLPAVGRGRLPAVDGGGA